jgi:hypothetical protein
VTALLGRGEVEADHLVLVSLRELAPVDGGGLGERAAEAEDCLVEVLGVDLERSLGR